MAMRVIWFAEAFLLLDPVAGQDLPHLLKSQMNSMTKLLRGSRRTDAKRAFEIVDDGQEFKNKGFLLCGGSAFVFLGAALAEIIEIGCKADIQFFLPRQFRLHCSEVVGQVIDCLAWRL